MSQGIGQALLNIGGDAAGIFHNVAASGRPGSLRHLLRNEEEVVPFTESDGVVDDCSAAWVARRSTAHSEEASIDALADHDKSDSRCVRSKAGGNFIAGGLNESSEKKKKKNGEDMD